MFWHATPLTVLACRRHIKATRQGPDSDAGLNQSCGGRALPWTGLPQDPSHWSRGGAAFLLGDGQPLPAYVSGYTSCHWFLPNRITELFTGPQRGLGWGYLLSLPWSKPQPRSPRLFPSACPDHGLARYGKKIPFHGVEKQEMGPEAALQGVVLVKEGGPTTGRDLSPAQCQNPFVASQTSGSKLRYQL